MVPWAQAGDVFAGGHPEPDGWLVTQRVLHHQMASGATCLSALGADGNGTLGRPANGSKGCGAVMRAAPLGFFYQRAAGTWDAACDIAAITHGHPDGIHPAGVLAVIIRLLADGRPLAGAISGFKGRSELAVTGHGKIRACRHGAQ
jgi:ADP-ribosylglycohydrolase